MVVMPWISRLGGLARRTAEIVVAMVGGLLGAFVVLVLTTDLVPDPLETLGRPVIFGAVMVVISVALWRATRD